MLTVLQGSVALSDLAGAASIIQIEGATVQLKITGNLEIHFFTGFFAENTWREKT